MSVSLKERNFEVSGRVEFPNQNEENRFPLGDLLAEALVGAAIKFIGKKVPEFGKNGRGREWEEYLVVTTIARVVKAALDSATREDDHAGMSVLGEVSGAVDQRQDQLYEKLTAESNGVLPDGIKEDLKAITFQPQPEK